MWIYIIFGVMTALVEFNTKWNKLAPLDQSKVKGQGQIYHFH